MDDPWGSPWADELQQNVIEKREDVRPKTPANAKLVVVEKGSSPWDEVEDGNDDGFGEWSTMPAGEEVLGKPLGFDGTSDSWHVPHKVEDRGLGKGDLNGHSTAWDESPTIHNEDESKLKPSLPLETEKAAELPSPDPWSTEPTWNDSGCEEMHTEGKDHAQEVPLEDKLKPEIKQHTSTNDAVPFNIDLISETDNRSDKPVGEEHTHQDNLAPEIPESEGKTVDDSIVAEVDHESSRPSTSPSDHSNHDEIPSESPRTSMDDEPSRPQIPRQSSSKVQELVEHFDKIAKAEIDEVVIVGGESFPEEGRGENMEAKEDSENLEEGEDEDDDFGDFEEGQSDTDEPEFQQKEPIKDHVGAQDSKAEIAKSSTLPEVSPPKAVPQKDFGRVQYDVNMSKLDKVFPGIPDESPDRIFIPDMVPSDSFSSVEQRKTWYRISRYGTMRKHNYGDDENYVRASWAQSQIRTDTLKIVARWMEEDRMSGRVILGGGSKGSSSFGWNDSNDRPVDLASAFAPRQGKKKVQALAPAEVEPEIPREWPKGLVRTRSTSKTRSPSKLRRTSSHSRHSSKESKPAPQALVASFGWNLENNSGAISPAPIPLASKPIPIITKRQSPPQQSRPSTNTPILSPIFSPTITLHPRTSSDLSGLDAILPAAKPAPNSQSTGTDGFNVDDDWGEMMSSPVVTSSPAFPPIKGLRHKKSQSLIGQLSESLQPRKQSVSAPSRSGHRHTASLDQILVPKTRAFANSRPILASISSPKSAAPSSLSNQYDIWATNPTANGNSGPFTSNVFTEPGSNSVSAPFNQPPTATSANGSITADPWATADFSFFDSAPPSPSKLTAAPMIKPARAPVKQGIRPKSMAFENPAPKPQAARPKSVAFAAPTPALPTRGNGKTKAEIEQDNVVSSIVKALPDLSYMLRR